MPCHLIKPFIPKDLVCIWLLFNVRNKEIGWGLVGNKVKREVRVSGRAYSTSYVMEVLSIPPLLAFPLSMGQFVPSPNADGVVFGVYIHSLK